MLHPALARALATAHIEDLHRAAARRRAIRFAVAMDEEQKRVPRSEGVTPRQTGDERSVTNSGYAATASDDERSCSSAQDGSATDAAVEPVDPGPRPREPQRVDVCIGVQYDRVSGRVALADLVAAGEHSAITDEATAGYALSGSRSGRRARPTAGGTGSSRRAATRSSSPSPL